MKIALHWFRRDLRLTDNTALWQATQDCAVVWPVFIFDPKLLSAPDLGAPRLQFLLDSLHSLEKNLESHGAKLIIRSGEVWPELALLIRETGATDLYWNRDYEPYARARDQVVEAEAKKIGVTPHHYKDGVILEPEEVLKGDGTPYAVFTPYSRIWRQRATATVLGTAKVRQTNPAPASEPLPTLAKLGHQTSAILPTGGERPALTRLQQFVAQGITRYQSQRNFPAIEGTSRLSADLRFGTLSPRQVYGQARLVQQQQPTATAEIDVFISELIWREFYRQILWHFPRVETGAYKIPCNQLQWENNERYFQAWCEGRTGFPIVDAAMRQLNQTGWMHNRLRMIVSSFLTKDLLVSWQLGERYFMQRLVDGDLAANNGGWQWSASTGTDAQPYFRIFNPTSQAEKFDPKGTFIERYVPEVNSLSYPPPLVDHAVQRQRTLQLFKALA
jgi:deoxyribodipyrimidine photo-lyase